MSYVSLYRKFRPDTFRDVKGQDHIVTTLQNQLQYDRVGHAYLFCGTRGTGKTTVAKILARAVNCEHPVDGNPCGECESCRRLAAGTAMNVVEIDAASNNGVDNIRDINAAVQYPPTEGKYIVYIIDEVHMLSTGAFNALLKTLEEPPSYVIFILATTEDMKVPVTIKSRCQRYDFHRISVETITGRLTELMEKEGIPTEPAAMRYIAQAADGSMRDALSILEECISASLGEKLTFERVLGQIGAVDVDVYLRLLDSLTGEKAEVMLDIVNDAVWKGKDLSRFVDDMVWFVRNVLFLKMAPGAGAGLDLTAETENRLLEAGKTVSEETLVRYLLILQELSVSIRNSTIRRITLEMGLIRMMKPESDRNYEAVIGRLEKLESRIGDNLPDGGANAGSKLPAGGVSAGGSAAPDGAAPTGESAAPDGAAPTGESAAPDGGVSAGGNAPQGLSVQTLAEMVHNPLVRSQIIGMINEQIAPYLEPEEGGADDARKRILKNRTPEEWDRLVRKKINENYPPATHDEILQIAREWVTKVVPKLREKKIQPEYLDCVSVEAGEVDQEKATINFVVLHDGQEDSNGLNAVLYFDDSERRQIISDVVRDECKKEITLVFLDRDVAKRGNEDYPANLQKILPDVEIVE